MADGMTFDIDSVMRKGLRALESQLGIIEIEQFISVVNREKNNYTEWRKTMFDDMTVEEFSEAAAEYDRKHPAIFKRAQVPIDRTAQV